MIHRIVYDTYPIVDTPQGPRVSIVQNHTLLEAYTDAEVDEIPQMLEKFHLKETGEKVKVKVLLKDIVHASIVLVGNLKGVNGYEIEIPEKRPDNTNWGGSLLDPSSL